MLLKNVGAKLMSYLCLLRGHVWRLGWDCIKHTNLSNGVGGVLHTTNTLAVKLFQSFFLIKFYTNLFFKAQDVI